MQTRSKHCGHDVPGLRVSIGAPQVGQVHVSLLMTLPSKQPDFKDSGKRESLLLAGQLFGWGFARLSIGFPLYHRPLRRPARVDAWMLAPVLGSLSAEWLLRKYWF
jgi:hypothetical protein